MPAITLAQLAAPAVAGAASGAATFVLKKATDVIEGLRVKHALNVAGAEEDVSGRGVEEDDPSYRPNRRSWAWFDDVSGPPGAGSLPSLAKNNVKLSKENDKLKDENAKLREQNAVLKKELEYQLKLSKEQVRAQSQLARANASKNATEASVWREKLASLNAQRAAEAQLYAAQQKAQEQGANAAIVNTIRDLSQKVDEAKERFLREGNASDPRTLISMMAALRSFMGGSPPAAPEPTAIVVTAPVEDMSDYDPTLAAILGG